MADTLRELTQRLYRDGAEASSLAFADENAIAVVLTPADLDLALVWRSTVSYNGTTLGATIGLTNQLQYSKNGGAWTTVDGASSVVRASASGTVSDGANTTHRLTTPSGGPWTFDGTAQFEASNGVLASVTLKIPDAGTPVNGIYTECCHCVKFRSADLVTGDTVQLRGSQAGTAFGTYTYTPTFTINLSPAKFFLLF